MNQSYIQNLENESFGGQFDFPTIETFENGDDFQSYVDFDSSVFNEEDDESVISGLCSASKKISKSDDSIKRSQKRSKRGRNPWTPKEDTKLMELMKKYGQSWAMISSCLPGRSGKQVRDRFLNKLRPNIKLGDWSAAEDELLVRLCGEIGNRWSLIASHLPGRTEGQVKNRYYSYIKKRIQSNGSLSQTNSISSRNISETSSSLAASPMGERAVFDFRQEFDFNLSNSYPVSLMNTGFATIPPMSSCLVTKGPMIAQPEIYSDQETNNTSVASYSPVRMITNDPTDLISYDVPTSVFCRQFSQAPVFNMVNESQKKVDVESFFSKENQQVVSGDKENERMMQLNQRKALLEFALAETLNEMKGY